MAAIVRYTDRMVCAVGLALTMSEVPALVMGILNIVQLNNNQGLVSDDCGTDAGKSNDNLTRGCAWDSGNVSCCE